MSLYKEFPNLGERFVENFLDNSELDFFMEEFLSEFTKGKSYYLAVIDLRKYRYKLNDEEQDKVKEFYKDDGNYIIPEEIFDSVFSREYRNRSNLTIEQKINNGFKTYCFKSEKSVGNFIESFPSLGTFRPDELNCYINLKVFGPQGNILYSN